MIQSVRALTGDMSGHGHIPHVGVNNIVPALISTKTEAILMGRSMAMRQANSK